MTPFYYIVVGVWGFLTFFFLRLNFQPLFNLAEKSVALLNDLLSDEDEDAKIELIQNRISGLINELFKVFAIIIVSFLIGLIPIFLFCHIAEINENDVDMTSFYFIISITIGGTIPFLLPGKKQESSYSKLSQLFHKLILDNYHISEKLFQLELKYYSKPKIKTRDDFLIISGLARSGTTSLMNSLFETSHFSSLDYANMPFLLSPNLWKKLYNPKKSKLRERSHKDGLRIGLDTVEALEEYFFKVKTEDSYISKSTLNEHDISSDLASDYLNYQKLIRKDNSSIYLAKNNNFLLRYNAIRHYNNNFLMIIMFREPLSHAHSLLNQHIKFSTLQEKDPFVEDYMNWLGHHEFGRNQKQFIFHNNPAIVNTDKFSIDYWLNIWINYYTYVLTINHTRTLVIHYDDYCKNPKVVMENILYQFGIKSPIEKISGFTNNRLVNEDYSEEIYKKAKTIYLEMKNIVPK